MNLVETLVLDVFDFFEFFEVLFVEFKQQKIVNVIPFCVVFCVRELSQWLDAEPGAAFDFIGYLKLETAAGKVALNFKPEHSHFGFVVMIDKLDNIVNANGEHGKFVEGVIGQVKHVLAELVVDKDRRG
jgi:hypothetical protein